MAEEYARRGGATSDDAPGSTVPQRVEFSGAGLREGVLAGVPVALGVAGYGLAFGVLARGAGLSVAEATLMSATVLAGVAQLVAVDLWADPVPVGTILATTLVINLRYLLLGATLAPWLGQLSPGRRYASAFFTADENWALTIARLRDGSRRGAFLLGSGLAVWAFWVAATAAGAVAGARIGTATDGLAFLVTGVFVAIAVDLRDGRGGLGPWAVAAAVAAAAWATLPGVWYVPAGGLGGALAAVVRDE